MLEDSGFGGQDVDVLGKYLRDVGSVDLLTPEEEVMLGEMIAKGDQIAMSLLVSANLRLVVSIAKRYVSDAVSLEDLIEEGNIGLMKAAKKFDYKRGVKFSTYADWFIRAPMIAAAASKNRTIRLPGHKMTQLSKVHGAVKSMSQQLWCSPTVEEIAKKLEMNPKEVSLLMIRDDEPIPLDADAGANASDGRIGDLIDGFGARIVDESMDGRELRDQIDMALAKLSPLEEMVVRLRNGIGAPRSYSYEEIGDMLNCSRTKVIRVETKAMRRFQGGLQHKDNRAVLRAFL